MAAARALFWHRVNTLFREEVLQAQKSDIG
jgi:hypothetical protein